MKSRKKVVRRAPRYARLSRLESLEVGRSPNFEQLEARRPPGMIGRPLRLRGQRLESRLVLANLLVDNPLDTVVASELSLRQAIAQANLDAAAGISDTIAFDASLASQTITLTQGPLELNGTGAGTITIDGGGQMAVSGNSQTGVFTVDSGAQVSIAGLTIEDGNSTSGGGIDNEGTLTVTNSTLSGNEAVDEGGGIYNASGSSLTVSNCTLADNSAEDGGGIDNEGTLTVTNSTIANNSGSQGGGLANLLNGSATLNNTIVAANTAVTGPDVSGAFISQGNNLTGATDGSSGWVGADLTGTRRPARSTPGASGQLRRPDANDGAVARESRY